MKKDLLLLVVLSIVILACLFFDLTKSNVMFSNDGPYGGIVHNQQEIDQSFHDAPVLCVLLAGLPLLWFVGVIVVCSLPHNVKHDPWATKK